MTTTMQAKYDGICSDCGRQIKVGQPIQATVEKGWRHASGLICKQSEPAEETQARRSVFVPEIPALMAGGPPRARVRLRTPGGHDFLLLKGRSISGGIEPVKVVSADKERFYGYIQADGRWREPRGGFMLDVVEAVKAFARAPDKAAAEYGMLYGICCFCARPLSDERSTKMGYGPICAGHYSLPWGDEA